VPLDYRLKNGDIVEIVTTKGDHGPSRDWMNLVRTSHAREKIRQWFKRQERDENIGPRPRIPGQGAAPLGPDEPGAVGVDRIMEIARAYKYENLDDFYAAVGYGAVGAQQVVTRLGVVDDAQLTLPPTAAPPSPSRQGGVRVKG